MGHFTEHPDFFSLKFAHWSSFKNYIDQMCTINKIFVEISIF